MQLHLFVTSTLAGASRLFPGNDVLQWPLCLILSMYELSEIEEHFLSASEIKLFPR
jgi:hypothetical protein